MSAETQAPPYPEHAKVEAVQEQSQTIGEFMEWLEDQGFAVCEPTAFHDMPWQPARKPITTMLALYFGVDLAVMEQEKRAMLALIRAVQQ